MPHFPEMAGRVKKLPSSVFEKFRPQIARQGKNLVRLHIGDTYLPPAFELPIQPEFLSRHPDMNRYCDTFGVEEFRAVLSEKLAEDNQLKFSLAEILVTCGATNALSASVQALVNPGDEVLVLTPCWPFFPGMILAAGGVCREAPFYTHLFSNPQMDIETYLEQFITPCTAVLYLNTPNNPSGKVLSSAQLTQVARFANRHRLWVISDEAYDGLTFDGREHISIASLPQMHDCTLSIFTFSKSFMFAGLRLGFLAAPSQVVQAVNRCMVHQLYSPSTLLQQMMIEPVKRRKQFIPSLQQHYQDLRDMFVDRLQIEVPVPEGTYFLFFSAEPFLNGQNMDQLMTRCLEAGVSVAPGGDFGKEYGEYIRICFTGEPVLRLELAVQRLNEIFTKIKE